jgi:hypothetical protein
MRQSSLGSGVARRIRGRTSAEDTTTVARLVHLRALIAEHGPSPEGTAAARDLVDLLTERGYPWRDEIPDELVLYMLQASESPTPATLQPAETKVTSPAGPQDEPHGPTGADALSLIRVSRHALTQCRTPLETMTEALEALALAHAIADRLAAHGPEDLRIAARRLMCAGRPTDGQPPAEPVRAARLTEVSDVGKSLTELAGLLGEVGIALVGVACGTDAEDLYWQCIEVIDRVDEVNDRVRDAVRSLSTPNRARITGQ